MGWLMPTPEADGIVHLWRTVTPYSPVYQRKALPDGDISVSLQRASHHQSLNTAHEVFDESGQKFKVQYIPNAKKNCSEVKRRKKKPRR